MAKPPKKKKPSKYNEKFILPKGMTADDILKLAANTPLKSSKHKKNDS